jgi:hypothetical protein
MGMDQEQDSIHNENGPATHSSRLDNGTPIQTMASPATSCGAVVYGTHRIIQRPRKKRTHAYRVHGLLEAAQVEAVPDSQTERTCGELSQCYRPGHMTTGVKRKGGERDNERIENTNKHHQTELCDDVSHSPNPA